MTFKAIPVLAIVLALFATACGGGGEATTTDTSAPEQITEAEAIAEAQAEAQAEAEAAAPEETVAATGEELYESNCARCHGSDGVGTRGPDLVDIATNVPDAQESYDQIVNGGSGMPSFGARLSEDEIQSMVDYIYATF